MVKINIELISLSTRKKLRQACLTNAKRHLKDANELFKQQKFGPSTFSAITAYEECLKVGLLNSLAQGILTTEQFNKFWGNHSLKFLSDHATIRFSEIKDKKIHQEFVLPNKGSHINTIVEDIIRRREKSLYVDLQNSKLSTPENMNPAIAIEEINRAYQAIENEKFLTLLSKKLKKAFVKKR